MLASSLTDQQRQLVQSPAEGRVFLEGPAGTGKTTAAVNRLLHLLQSGVAARSILLVVPQRTLAAPYTDALRRPSVDAGGQVTVFTISGLAQRMVDLFWPLIAEKAGFARPDDSPTFLTLETAQYYMARVVLPLLDEGYFRTVVIDRNRLYSQIIDNLNKAAVVGFAHTEIGGRLKSAWGGKQSEKRIYEEAQDCASRFRELCLTHNLLDFSLQLDVFVNHLWALPLCRDYLLETYTHLIVENVEEDTPVAHDVLREWLPHCRSGLVIYDHEGGYRRFLGADPEGGRNLRELCEERVALGESFVVSPNLHAFGEQLSRSLQRMPMAPSAGVRSVLTYEASLRFYPQMLDWVADQIADLVRRQGVAPGEIAVLSPFLPDSLRFSLMNRLSRREIPARSHRPSRSLREESATLCLLTLAALAHPQWGVCPSKFDVAYALMQSIEEMDLVRAQLLAEIVYRCRQGEPTLGSFDPLNPGMKERLTYLLGERYERLRAWIEGYIGSDPAELDHFLRRLFGELLSQPGFGFHRDYDAAGVTANLIESVQKFRWVTGGDPLEEGKTLGQQYVEMVQAGVVAAQYVRSWRLQPEDAVLLAPAYTFLMRNRPVDVQFWLDVGSSGWFERLYQPLTHPYVLSRHWPAGAVWTDGDELEVRRQGLLRLSLGLVRRCRRKIFLGLSELGESGSEQKGELLQAIQRVLRQLPHHLPMKQEGDGV